MRWQVSISFLYVESNDTKRGPTLLSSQFNCDESKLFDASEKSLVVNYELPSMNSYECL